MHIKLYYITFRYITIPFPGPWQDSSLELGANRTLLTLPTLGNIKILVSGMVDNICCSGIGNTLCSTVGTGLGGGASEPRTQSNGKYL